MFRCAFLGCGGRARGHAQAYKHVQRGRLIALCDMDEARLKSFGDDFGVETRYTDMSTMLEKEKPDLLHIVTPPTIRHSLMSLASEHGVPAVIIEKPIALQSEDYKQIRELERTSKTKFVVNTQLHFHPHNLMLKKQVMDGEIGDVRFVDASARSTPIDQGPHVLQLVSSYIDWARPTQVFGNVSGGGGHLEGRQPSPAHGEAAIAYEGGIRAQVTFGTRSAPMSNPSESVYMHKRVATYGTKGWTHWYMAGWERFTVSGGYEAGSHSYGEQDLLAQAGLTEAVFDWLEHDKPHPTRLATSLHEFGIILGMYTSALRREPIDLPFDPPDGLIDELKKALPS
ncbi:Gfo/Idh/MocA family oxidoreductase [Candidatus Poribacteria bacterium]|nr:Gfo/Idh/MocA family oxidoreductase [Candidatus Poribacteria bacterium]